MFSRILKNFLRTLLVVQAVLGSLAAQTSVDVLTGEATQVKDLSATLNGTLNAHSVGLWVWFFEIGRTDSFEMGQLLNSSNATVDGAATGANTVPLSLAITNLIPSTTYFYRLGARQSGNSNNTIYGSPRLFTTGPPATRPLISDPPSGTPLETGHNVAVMRATIKSGSSPAKVFIQYGPTIAYGLRAEFANPVPANSEAVAQIRLTNLTPGSTYHYCWMASNAEGTVTGEDRIFSTPAAPLVETLAATEVTYFSAVLHGRANPRGGATMSPYFDVGATTSYGAVYNPDNLVFLIGNSTSDVQVRISNLAANTTYHFRLRCSQYNTENNTSGSDFTFTTGPAGTLPSIESEPRAEEINGYSARLRLDRVSAGDSQSSAILEYGTTNQYGFTVVLPSLLAARSSDNIVSEVIGNLLPATIYYYRFRITNNSGFIYSTPATFTTPSPPVVATLPAKKILDVSATLCGSVVANGNPCEIRFEWGTDTTYGNVGRGEFNPATPLQELDFLFPAATIIHFRLNVTDGKNVYLGQDQSFRTLPLIPKPPAIYSIRMNTAPFTYLDPRPFISWNTAQVVVDYFGGTSPFTLVVEYGTTTAYGMESGTAGSSPSQSGTSILVKDLTAATTYHCRARVSSGLGTVFSGDFTFTTMAVPVILSLPAVNVTDHGATLATSLDPKGWIFLTEIEYGPTSDCGMIASQINLASVDGWKNGHVVGAVVNLTAVTEALLPSTTYYYRLRCTTPVLDGSRVLTSAVGSFTTRPPSTPPRIIAGAVVSGITSDSATITLSGVEAGSSAATAVFDYGQTTAYGSQATYSGVMPAWWAGNPSVTLTGLAPGLPYHVRATVQNSQGMAQTQDITFFTVPPGLKPTITGGISANVIAPDRVILSGFSVNAGDGATTIAFEYGPTSTYGSSVPLANPITTGNTGYPQVWLETLQPATLYHVRCTASNVYGSVSTPDKIFTTYPVPVITTLAASQLTDLSAVLNASANANGAGYNPTFEWGLSTSYGNTLSSVPSYISGSTATALSVALPGLLPSTTYHYRIKAGTFLGNDIAFTTAAASTLPVIIGNIIPFAINPNGVSLKVATSVKAGGSAATVVFEYGFTTSYEFESVVPGSIPAGTTAASPSVSITGLSPDTLYHGRCRVTNSQGTTYSADIIFSTAFQILTQPATEIGDITSRANGSVNAGGGTLSSLTFQWGTTPNYGNGISAIPSTTSGTGTLPVSTYLSGLLPDTLYYYRLAGYDGTGTFLTGPQMTFRTSPAASPPSVPDPVVVSSLGLDTATVRASKVQPGGSAATVAFEYGLTQSYGSVVVYGNPLSPGNSTGVQMNLSGLSPATTYYVRCRAQNAQGTAYSPNTTFTTPAVPVLTATNASNVTDMTATMNGQALYPGLTLYSLRFSYGTGGNYNYPEYSITSTPEGTPGSYILSKNLTGLLPSTTYQYRIEASSPWGQNYVSAAKTFTTGPPNTPPTMEGVLTVSLVSDTKARLYPPLMKAGSSNATVVYQYGLTTAYGSTKTGPSISSNQASKESVDLTSLQPATTYHVRCKATNTQGIVQSGDVAFTTSGTPVVTTLAPGSVTDITAIFNGTVNPKGGTVSVGYEWGESSLALTPLTITSNNTSFQNVTGTSALPFPSGLLNFLKPRTTYYFRILAWDALTIWRGNLLSFTTPAPSTLPSLNGSFTVVSITTRTAIATFKNPLLESAIFAGGNDATTTIQYGTTTAYGSSVTLMNTGSSVSAGDSLTAAIGTMRNLLGGTVYHARLKVSSLLGTAYSGDVAFVTLSDPVVATGGVTTPGEFTAQVSGDVTSGPGIQDLVVFFDWGLTETYGSSSPAAILVPPNTTRQLAQLITGLSPGKIYHYRVRAAYSINSQEPDIWYYGADRTFSTSAAATPPGVTTGPIVSNIKSTTAIVQTAYFTGSSFTTVTLEYGTTIGYGSQMALATNSTPNATANGNATLSGLLPSTVYHVRAKAVNAQGTAYGPDATFTTLTPPVLALASPNGISSSAATLNGTVVSGDATMFSFRFEWGLTTAYGSTANANRDVNNLSAAISGLVPSTIYHYRLVATDVTTVRFTEDASVSSGPSPVPPVLSQACSAYSITPTAATLWISSVSAPATVIFDYGVTTSYGSVAVSPQSFSPDGTLRNVTVELANLLPNTLYHYRCRAINVLGTTLGSDGTFRTLDLPSMLTQIPDRLKDKSLVLHGEINARNGLLAPSFEMGTTPAYGQVVAVPAGMVSGASPQPVAVDVTGLLPETTYHFRLKARDPRGGEYVGLPMTVQTLSVAQAWRLKYFGVTDNTGTAGDIANPSSDGISNLMKYALDLDPRVSSALPAMGGLSMQGSGRRLGFSFIRDAEKRDINYIVEAASTPSGPWQPLATSTGGLPSVGAGLVGESDAGGSKRNVEAQDLIEMSQASSRFVRLRVIREAR